MELNPAGYDDHKYCNPMSTAPKDGTFVWLLIEMLEDDDCSIALLTDDNPSWTIGSNSFAHTEQDEWQVVGWDWCTDEFTDLSRTENGFRLLGWKPCDIPLQPEEVDYQQHLKEKGQQESC